MKKPESKPKVELAAMRGGVAERKKPGRPSEDAKNRRADAVVDRMMKGKRPK